MNPFGAPSETALGQPAARGAGRPVASRARVASLATLAAVLLPLLLLSACKRTPGGAPDAASVGATLATDAGSDGGTSDDVEAVYPVDPKAPIAPLAQKLCATLTESQELKRAACCSSAPGVVTTAECTRTLSAALGAGAVEVDEGALAACAAAFDKTLEGCDWVGPFAPVPPPACQRLLRGKLTAGQRCRSSLECAGALRCKGVGPTNIGSCTAAKAVGEPCGGVVDTLATYTRQTDESQHPECATGHCIKHRCAEAVAENAPCLLTTDCAEGLSCLPSGKGKACLSRPLPKEGEPCPAGVCDGALSCIQKRCTMRKNTGESCSQDFECRGGCRRGDGGLGRGTCGPRCDIR